MDNNAKKLDTPLDLGGDLFTTALQLVKI